MGSVPPACRGNLKEGVLVHSRFYELWLRDRYHNRNAHNQLNTTSTPQHHPTPRFFNASSPHPPRPQNPPFISPPNTSHRTRHNTSRKVHRARPRHPPQRAPPVHPPHPQYPLHSNAPYTHALHATLRSPPSNPQHGFSPSPNPLFNHASHPTRQHEPSTFTNTRTSRPRTPSGTRRQPVRCCHLSCGVHTGWLSRACGGEIHAFFIFGEAVAPRVSAESAECP